MLLVNRDSEKGVKKVKKKTPIPAGYDKLAAEKVESGQVYVRTLFENRTHAGCYRVGQLIVMPHSAIALHDHDKGCEWYLDEDTGSTYFCPKGGAHKFVNNTNTEKHLIFVQKEEAL